MTEEELKFFASQLRKPHGEFATTIVHKMNVGNKLINTTAIEALALEPNDTVLEIGMANGLYVNAIVEAASSIHYVGCDFSEEMIRQANHLNQHYVQQGRAAFILSNADELPFQEDSFTKLFTVNTLYFWEDPVETLKEFSRVLQPNGKLVVAIRPKASMELYPFVKYGFTKYSREELEVLLGANGFVVTNVIEKEELEQEISGQKVKVELVIVCAENKKQ
jgi:ubiquinone/menaquinone biosynthesis C-methylase UbiE